MITRPSIVIATVMGAFAIANTTFDIFVMIIFGVIGYALRRLDFPIPPFVIGLVLGSLAEVNLRRSMMLGGIGIFFTRPISLVIIIVSLLILCIPLFKKLKGSRKA